MKIPTEIPSAESIAADIQRIGFSCQRCGACCRSGPDDSGLVFASHDEVEALVSLRCRAMGRGCGTLPGFSPPMGTGLPLPSVGASGIGKGGAGSYQTGDAPCTLRAPGFAGPIRLAWSNGDLVVSDCPGLGGSISEAEALALATDLLERARFENEDEERVRRIFPTIRFPEGKRCVVDGSGLRVCEE